MSENTNYFMKQLVTEILKADRWRCRVCDRIVDAGSNVSTEDIKESILLAHLHDDHNESLLINKEMPDRYKVGYFHPYMEKLQDNVKIP